jgi:hypothetical protein
MRIHVNGFVFAPVAEEMVKLLERFLVLTAVALVCDRDVFVGVQVMKRQRAGIAVGDSGFEAAIAEQDHQGRKPYARRDPAPLDAPASGRAKSGWPKADGPGSNPQRLARKRNLAF